MEKITYDLIQPLITKEEVRGSEIYCLFAAPKSDKVIESSAYIQKSNSSEIKQNMKQSLLYGLKSAVSSLIYRVCSSFGMVGSIVGSATSSAAYAVNVNTNTTFSKEEKKTAVVEAFKKVMFNFYWDEKAKTWANVKALSPFMEQLAKQPIDKNYDKEIMARMLVELSNLDQSITAEEKEFIRSFIPQDAATVEDLLQKGAVSNIELKEIEAKETVLMLAWTVVLIDESLSAMEKEKMQHYASQLTISDEKLAELKSYAQQYIIDQGASIGAFEQKEALFQLADQIELSHEAAERMLIRYKKRA